jgi:phosphatidylinositol glycan class M
MGSEVWWFGAVTGGTLFILNWSLWSMYVNLSCLPAKASQGLIYSWGQPFLDNTFLYHLTRLDHRHNFSPYFYPIYQTLFPSSSSSNKGWSLDSLPLLARVLRHPLTSFLPQTTLVGYAGFKLPKVIGIEGTLFFQTVLFVVFNKVVTSQVSRPLFPLYTSKLWFGWRDPSIEHRASSNRMKRPES